MIKIGYDIEKIRTKILFNDHKIAHAWISTMMKKRQPLKEHEFGGVWLPGEIIARHNLIVKELKSRKPKWVHKTPIVMTPQLREIEKRYRFDLQDTDIESWFELKRQVKRDAGKKVVVLGEGNKKRPAYMVIGESPGNEEIRKKKPFIGRSGRYLDRVLSDLKLDRKDIYITNALKFVNEIGSPTMKEIREQKKYLQAEIDLVKPQKVVALGRLAPFALAGLRIGYAKAPHPGLFRFIGKKVLHLIKRAFRRN